MSFTSVGQVLLVCCISSLVAQNALQAESVQCYRTFSREEFPGCELLSDTYALHWKLEDSNVTFAIDVVESPSGWIALGTSQAGGMKGADIWMVQQTGAGVWTVKDMHSLNYEAPIMDSSQDVSLVGTPVANGSTIAAVLTRRFKACDVSDLTIVPNITSAYIWAHAAKPGFHGDGNRGSRLIKLDTSSKAVERVGGVTRQALLMHDFTVPTDLNSYWCMNFKLPSDRKYHTVEALANITSPMVHHIILFACTLPPREPLGKPYECSSMSSQCTTVHLGWVPGLDTWTAPEEAGLPLPRYYAMQMHYNNPRYVEGAKDSSGLTLGFTPNLRENDLAILVLGQMNLTIPAGEANYTAPPAVCPAECTSKFTEPLQLIQHLFHMHTSGSSIRTQHLRDGQELMAIDELTRYDYNHQRLSDMKPGVSKLMPGDTLITTCSYNTSSKTTVTKYGERTEDEMCFDLLMYYPAQGISSCMPMALGVAACFNTVRFNAWMAQKAVELNGTLAPGTSSPSNPAPTPALSNPADHNTTAVSLNTPTNATANGTSTSMPGSNGSRPFDASKFFTAAMMEGFFVLYDPDTPNLERYRPYKPVDNCPAFLSAADNGPEVDSTRDAKQSAAQEQVSRSLAGSMLLVLAAAAVLHM